jgi:hypothetical protein
VVGRLRKVKHIYASRDTGKARLCQGFLARIFNSMKFNFDFSIPCQQSSSTPQLSSYLVLHTTSSRQSQCLALVVVAQRQLALQVHPLVRPPLLLHLDLWPISSKVDQCPPPPQKRLLKLLLSRAPDCSAKWPALLREYSPFQTFHDQQISFFATSHIYSLASSANK